MFSGYVVGPHGGVVLFTRVLPHMNRPLSSLSLMHRSCDSHFMLRVVNSKGTGVATSNINQIPFFRYLSPRSCLQVMVSSLYYLVSLVGCLWDLGV